MARNYRLTFDASVYYAVTGLFLQLWAKTTPSVLGFGLLCVALLLSGILSTSKRIRQLRYVPLLLPVLVLLDFQVATFLHMLPAWIYCGASLIGDRADIEYKEFQDRITKSVVPICSGNRSVFGSFAV